MDKSGVYHFLSRQKLGALGSISPESTVQSALVGIAVTPKLELSSIRSAAPASSEIWPLIRDALSW
jgi:hypothetical protein